MFSQLRRSIMGHLFVFSILFTIIMSAVSFWVVGRSGHAIFQASAEEAVTHRVTKSLFAMAAVENSAVQIAKNSTVLQALSTDQYSLQVNPILNTLKNTSFGILGVTLYTPQHIYTTDSVSDHLTFYELRENQAIRQFMDSPQETFLSIRTSQIPGVYNHVRYDPAYGMITYCVKVPHGLLLFDLNPSYIYSRFFDYGKYPNFTEIQTFIMTPEGTYLKSGFNKEKDASYLIQAVEDETIISDDRRFLIISTPFGPCGSQVVSLVPTAPFYRQMAVFGAILLICSAVLIRTALAVGRRLSSSIILPLTRLRKKMAGWNA